MRCPACDTENVSETPRCSSCGSPLRPARRRRGRRRHAAEETVAPSPALAAANHRAALRAYRVSVLGLIPGLGLLLGPLAVVLGAAVRRRVHSDPDLGVQNLATASVVLGALATLTNWLGLALLIQGLRHW
jgi:hypothetical protein